MGCNCQSKDDMIVEMVRIWKNTTWKSPEEKKEANRRVGVCLTSGKDGGPCGSNKSLMCRQNFIWIPAKARSMIENCPIDKW